MPERPLIDPADAETPKTSTTSKRRGGRGRIVLDKEELERANETGDGEERAAPATNGVHADGGWIAFSLKLCTQKLRHDSNSLISSAT